MAGNFGAISVNNRLRELHERIDALEARIGTETPEIHAAIVETVTRDSAEVITLEQFDWKTSGDVKALKEFALSEFGFEVKGNKKAGTVRAEIEAHLAGE